MPIAFIFFGAIFVIAAVRDTLKDGPQGKGLISLLRGDVTGPNNFLYWIAVVWILGAIGYSDDFKPLSNIMLVLFVVVILLGHKGFFQQLQQQLGATQVASNNNGSINSPLNIGQIQPIVPGNSMPVELPPITFNWSK